MPAVAGMFFWVEEMDKNKPQRVLVVDDDMLIREVLKAILRSEGFKVVMITGEASTGTVRDAVSSGASGYIIKPFNAKRVSAVLRTAFKLPGDSPFS
jgi:DNA-binding NtrC family response regulator